MSIILLLMLTLSCAALHRRKCIKQGENEMLCEENEETPSTNMKECCYDLEKDYYYCCPVNEHRSMTHQAKVTGSIIAAVALMLMILLLCSFCKKCPINKIFLRRRRQPDNTEGTQGASTEQK